MNRGKAALLTLVLLSMALAGHTGYQMWAQGHEAAAGRQGGPVVRNTATTRKVLTDAVEQLRLDSVRVADAWLEPGCDGAGLFIRTENDAFWAWYDLEGQRVTEYLDADQVLAAAWEETRVLPNAYTWRRIFDGPGHRNRYYAGPDREGQMVLVWMNTEECGIGTGYVERTRSRQQQGTLQEVTFFPQRLRTEPAYGDFVDSEPAVPWNDKITTEVFQIIESLVGQDNYGGFGWVEPACDLAFVFQHFNDEPAYYWTLYDPKSKEVVEYLTHEEILTAVYAQWPEHRVEIYSGRWNDFHDAPGRRARFLIGTIDDRQAWLHFNSKECSLLPAQIQLSQDSDDMGEWVTLPITHTLVIPAPTSGSEQNELKSEKDMP